MQFVLNGGKVPTATVDIHNLGSKAGNDLTAGLDLDSIASTGSLGVVTIDGPLFANVPAGESEIIFGHGAG